MTPAKLGDALWDAHFQGETGRNDPLSTTHAMYQVLSRKLPGLTPDQFNGLMHHLWDKGVLQLHVLNEVRTLTPEQLAVTPHRGNPGDENYAVYGFALWDKDKKGAMDKAGEAAQEYFARAAEGQRDASRESGAAREYASRGGTPTAPWIARRAS